MGVLLPFFISTMTLEFQQALLRCLFQLPELRDRVQDISSSVFDMVEDQVVIELLNEYIKTYGSQPSKEEIGEFFSARIHKKNIPDDVSKKIIQTLHSCYLPVEGEMEHVKRVMNGEVQRKRAKGIIQKALMNLKDTPADQVKVIVDQLSHDLGEVGTLGRLDGTEIYRSAGFITDPFIRPHMEGRPTVFDSLNRMTSAGGFKTPELIILLSAPKNFKTGVLISLALGFMKDGLKVYYADGENGEVAIRKRVEQSILQCTEDELKDPNVYGQLDEALKWYTMQGGNMVIDSYIAFQATTADVHTRIKQLKADTGFSPDVIIWDSIDHFLPSTAEDRKKDERLKIRKTYFEVIAINKLLGCFSIAPSQVNRAAVDKKVFSMKDFAEDFGKAANCHATFALCRTPKEVEAKIARIVPVVQRQGVRFHPNMACILEIQEDIGSVKEISEERAEELLMAVE